jgi:hypothetical protein
LPSHDHGIVDVRRFAPGERIVFEPYTREMYERTHRWMEEWNLFPADQLGCADYEVAVAVRGCRVGGYPERSEGPVPAISRSFGLQLLGMP